VQSAIDGHVAEGITVNWPAGLRALAAAFCLAGVATGYHAPLAGYGGAAIALYAMSEPLRLRRLLFTRGSLGILGSLAIRTAAALTVVFATTLAINSGAEPLATLGNALLIGLLVFFAAVIFRFAWRRIQGWLPSLATASAYGLGAVQGWLSWAAYYMPQR
jgi:hypothetical protein